MSQPVEFAKRVITVHRQLGGKATAGDVWAHLQPLTTGEEQEGFLRRGALAAIASTLRRKNPDTGLPYAPAIGSTYVQLELLSVEEYAHLIWAHSRSKRREEDRIRQLQEHCESVHDVWLTESDAERIATEASA